MLRANSRIHSAFTLIELLVVVAIIGILAAILFPVFARAKDAAKRTVDLAHVKQISVAKIIYVADYDNTFISFPFADTWSVPSYSNGQKGPYWTDRLMPYMKSNEIFASPSNTDHVYYYRGYLKPGATAPGEPAKYRVTFAINHLIAHSDFSPDFAGAASESAIEYQAETVLIGPQQQSITSSSCQPDSPGSQTMSFYWNISTYDSGYGFHLWGQKGLEGGFFGGANFSFVDSHARFARTVKSNTHPGDQYVGHDPELFYGYFAGIKTHPRISDDGTCPMNRTNAAF